MLKPSNKYSKFFFIIFFAVFQFACSKNESRNFGEIVSINSITPADGKGNTVVTIKGSNFSPDITENLVKFNNDSALVLKVSTDSLVVLSPPNGSTGPVSVTINGNSVTGPVFTYILDSVNIYAVAPAEGIIFWKNDIETFLGPTQGNFGGAYALAISGEDVYIAGYSYYIAAYWKNGVKTTLSDPNTSAQAKTLALSGNDIYVGGSESSLPVYWKNGTKINLPSNSIGRVNALVINENNIYAVGYEAGNMNDQDLVYWKNGNRMVLGTRE